MHCIHTEEGGESRKLQQKYPRLWEMFGLSDDLMSADHVKRISPPHIMIVLSPDHKEARDARHVWPAQLRVNFIQQHRSPSVDILCELSFLRLLLTFYLISS